MGGTLLVGVTLLEGGPQFRSGDSQLEVENGTIASDNGYGIPYPMEWKHGASFLFYYFFVCVLVTELEVFS